MKLHRLIGMIAVVVPLGALAAVAPVVPLAAERERNGQLHIVKDCGEESGVPGEDFCTIVTSNVPELPAGTRIYYDLSPGPTIGPGYFDNNIFVFVNTKRWAVGRCTGRNNINTPGKGGLCTLSDGFGQLAGFSARVDVTYSGGSEFAWDGTYSFNPPPER